MYKKLLFIVVVILATSTLYAKEDGYNFVDIKDSQFARKLAISFVL